MNSRNICAWRVIDGVDRRSQSDERCEQALAGCREGKRQHCRHDEAGDVDQHEIGRAGHRCVFCASIGSQRVDVNSAHVPAQRIDHDSVGCLMGKTIAEVGDEKQGYAEKHNCC
jgi:hypothetical protein